MNISTLIFIIAVWAILMHDTNGCSCRRCRYRSPGCPLPRRCSCSRYCPPCLSNTTTTAAPTMQSPNSTLLTRPSSTSSSITTPSISKSTPTSMESSTSTATPTPNISTSTPISSETSTTSDIPTTNTPTSTKTSSESSTTSVTPTPNTPTPTPSSSESSTTSDIPTTITPPSTQFSSKSSTPSYSPTPNTPNSTLITSEITTTSDIPTTNTPTSTKISSATSITSDIPTTNTPTSTPISTETSTTSDIPTSNTPTSTPISTETSTTSDIPTSHTPTSTPSPSESSTTSDIPTSNTPTSTPISTETSTTSDIPTSHTPTSTPSPSESSTTSDIPTSNTPTSTPISTETSTTSDIPTSNTPTSTPISTETSTTSDIPTSHTPTSTPSPSESSTTSDIPTSNTPTSTPISTETSTTSDIPTSNTPTSTPISTETSTTSDIPTSHTPTSTPSPSESSTTSDLPTSNTPTSTPISTETSTTSDIPTSNTPTSKPISTETSTTSDIPTSHTPTSTPSPSESSTTSDIPTSNTLTSTQISSKTSTTSDIPTSNTPTSTQISSESSTFTSTPTTLENTTPTSTSTPSATSSSLSTTTEPRTTTNCVWNFEEIEASIYIGSKSKGNMTLLRNSTVNCETDCLAACVQMPQCKEFNYYFNSRICELGSEKGIYSSEFMQDDCTALYWTERTTIKRVAVCISGKPCDSNPCQNGGVCESKPLSTVANYTCKCDPKFVGVNCEVAVPLHSGVKIELFSDQISRVLENGSLALDVKHNRTAYLTNSGNDELSMMADNSSAKNRWCIRKIDDPDGDSKYPPYIISMCDDVNQILVGEKKTGKVRMISTSAECISKGQSCAGRFRVFRWRFEGMIIKSYSLRIQALTYDKSSDEIVMRPYPMTLPGRLQTWRITSYDQKSKCYQSDIPLFCPISHGEALDITLVNSNNGTRSIFHVDYAKDRGVFLNNVTTGNTWCFYHERPRYSYEEIYSLRLCDSPKLTLPASGEAGEELKVVDVESLDAFGFWVRHRDDALTALMRPDLFLTILGETAELGARLGLMPLKCVTNHCLNYNQHWTLQTNTNRSDVLLF